MIDAVLLIIDDSITVGIDQNTTGDLLAILTSWDGKVPTIIAAQSGPGYWAETIPDQIAADSIVNKLARNARRIELGTVDVRELIAIKQRGDEDSWEKHPSPGAGTIHPDNADTTSTRHRYRLAGILVPTHPIFPIFKRQEWDDQGLQHSMSPKHQHAEVLRLWSSPWAARNDERTAQSSPRHRTRIPQP